MVKGEIELNNLELIDAYYRSKKISKMEIDSFNQFLDLKLNEIVDENKFVSPKMEEVRIELSKIEVLKPRIIEADGSPRSNFFPMEARLRNRTYASPIFLTMTLLRRDVEQDVKKAYIGDLPVMLKSNRCWLEGKSDEELVEMGEDPLDFGGYFIINGSEKALMTQEVLASDRVMIAESSQEKTISEVISTRGAFKGRTRVIRSPDGTLNVTFPASPKKLNLYVLLKALGMKSTNQITDAFSDLKEIRNDVLINFENLDVKDEEEALDKIGKYVAPGQVIDYRLKRAQEVVDAFLLPHIGQNPEDRLAKAYFLCMMAEKAIEKANGLRGEDDKDHYANKRVELSGKLMEHLFRYAFKYFIKDLKFQIDRTITRRRKLNISTVVRPGAVTERIRFAMSTGNWIGRATGVSKFMDRVNYIAPLTDLRKVKSPLDKSRELYEARDVHGTHWGRLDCIETPDGPQCVSPETEMLLDDYTAIQIKDFEEIWRNKKISSIDWNKEDKSEVKSSIARFIKLTPNKKVFKIKTKETGRELIATIDHPFYSELKGKTDLSNLHEGERVAVLPIKALKFEKPVKELILSEQDIINACPEKSDQEHILNELKSKNLIPFYSDNENILIASKILGHLFGDGSLTLSMKKFKSNYAIVFSGNKGDLEDISLDVKKLGFNASKISQLKRKSILTNGRIIEGTSTLMHCYSKPLWVFFKALGAPNGDKVLTEYSIPAWIKNQRKIVVKEFLSAYFGSEMTKPQVDKRDEKIFLQPTFSLNKSKDLVLSGIKFTEELKELLSLFDVNISKTKIVDCIQRKSGIETRKIKVLFSSKIDSLLNLFGLIGFNYCRERNSLARLAFEYLLTKKTLIEKRTLLQQSTINLSNKGFNEQQILSELKQGLRLHDVLNWVKKSKQGDEISPRVSEIDFPKFDEWIRSHAISENGLCWETIESIQETNCSEVMDVTTLQDYHNFFANGFLTGNCGLVKNLCLLAEVTTESSQEPVEKLLNEMGVKLK